MTTIILIGIFLAIFVAIVLVIQFPEMLSAVATYVDALIYYMGQAMDIVWLFVPKAITVPLMSLAVAVELLYLGYQLVMWIIRKLPTASMR